MCSSHCRQHFECIFKGRYFVCFLCFTSVNTLTSGQDSFSLIFLEHCVFYSSLQPEISTSDLLSPALITDGNWPSQQSYCCLGTLQSQLLRYFHQSFLAFLSQQCIKIGFLTFAYFQPPQFLCFNSAGFLSNLFIFYLASYIQTLLWTNHGCLVTIISYCITPPHPSVWQSYPLLAALFHGS